MSEYDPLDIGSESEFILRNQLSDNYFIFNEDLTWNNLVGAAFIIAGIVFNSRSS